MVYSDRSTVLNRKRNATRSEDDEEDQHLVNLCRRTDSRHVLIGKRLCVRCSKQCELGGSRIEGITRLLGCERLNVPKRLHSTNRKRTLKRIQQIVQGDWRVMVLSDPRKEKSSTP